MKPKNKTKLSARERSERVGQPWPASLLSRVGYRQLFLQSDGEPTVVRGSQNSNPVGSMFVWRWFSREGPVGEHVSNGFAKSAMREVNRQTRTLLWNPMWVRSIHIPSQGGCRRWRQMLSASSGLEVMASRWDARRGLFSVPKNAPFRDHENSFTGHVPPI